MTDSTLPKPDGTVSGARAGKQVQSQASGEMAQLLRIVALTALLTSAAYFLHFRNLYFPDSPSYVAPAVSMLAGHGFTAPDGAPETLRTPGYPMMLTPFLWAHLDLKYVVIFQHLLRILLIVAVTAFALKVSRSPRVALWTGALLIIDFPLLEAANSILTEMIFTAILVIVYWLLWSEAGKPGSPGFRLLAAGILAGASVLVRPISLFFFVPAMAYLAIVRPNSKVRASVVFLAGFVCFPLAWMVRNDHAIGRFTVSTISGFSALQYRAAGAVAIGLSGDFHTNLEASKRELEDRACREMQQLYSRDCIQISVAAKSEYYSRLGRKVVAEHPFLYLKVAARGAAVMMLDGGPTTLSGIAGTSWPTGMRVLLVYTLPMLCLALYGMVRCWGMNRSLFWLSAFVIGYFVVISAGPEANARFRVPFLPLYALLSAVGIDSVAKRFS